MSAPQSLNRAARRRADLKEIRRKAQMLAWRQEFAHSIGKIESENVKLRNVCKDFLYALHEYAKGENWAQKTDIEDPGEDTNEFIWVGEGDGPDLARKALAMKAEGEAAMLAFDPPKEPEGAA